MNRKDFKLDKWLGSDASCIAQSPNEVQTQCIVSQDSDIETITQRIEQAAIDIAPSYADWRDLGFALADALGENGRSYYHRISRFYEDYSAAETDKQFTACLNAHGHGVTAKTFFQLAKNAGVSLSVPTLEQRTFQSSNPKNKDCRIEQTVSDDDEPPIKQPTFPDDVYADLPSLLKQVVAYGDTPEDKDLLLLGSIVTLSAALPNIYGIYANRSVYPNLYLFITAQAAAGKGQLSLCSLLVAPIHNELLDRYKQDRIQYESDMIQYNANKSSIQKPVEPAQKMLIIPANNSSTGVYQILNDNHGCGLLFETEGDTLSQTFKSDYGNFSDGFRKAFHHEAIKYNRRTNREYAEITCPRLSAVLSGTPKQISALIPDAENGLFSRFIFYYMNANLDWKNVFANNDVSLDYQFEQLGKDYLIFYHWLQGFCEPIRFAFTSAQQQNFNAYMRGYQQQYLALCGQDYLGTLHRLGIITFRIAMVLSALRLKDTLAEQPILVCSDSDYHTAMSILHVLLQHAAYVFGLLPQQQALSATLHPRMKFLQSLPQQFNRQDYLQVANNLSINEKTAEKWIEKLVANGFITKPSKNNYIKVKL